MFPAPPADDWFSHDDVQFRFRKTPGNVLFVFQHGLGASLDQPLNLFTPPPGISLASFDFRGHGQTHPLGDRTKINLGSFADDLLAFLNHLNADSLVVGGISMGAAVALNFALRFPERLLGLILSRPAWLDAPNPFNVSVFSNISRLIRDFGPKVGRQRFEETPLFHQIASQYPDTARSLLLQFENQRALENAINLEQIPLDRPNANREQWRSIQVPTLILANRQDPIHPFEYGQIMSQFIPKSEFREITSKSASPSQHARDVQQSLEEFFRRHFPLPSSA